MNHCTRTCFDVQLLIAPFQKWLINFMSLSLYLELLSKSPYNIEIVLIFPILASWHLYKHIEALNFLSQQKPLLPYHYCQARKNMHWTQSHLQKLLLIPEMTEKETSSTRNGSLITCNRAHLLKSSPLEHQLMVPITQKLIRNCVRACM